jgi:hypothetical protein
LGSAPSAFAECVAAAKTLADTPPGAELAVRL